MKIKTTLRDLSMAIELMKEMQANHEARKHVDNNKNIPFDYKGAIEFALEMRNESLYYELKDNYGIDFEVGLNENDTYEFIMTGVQTEALNKKQEVEMENIYNQDKEVIGTRPKRKMD